MQEHCRKPTRGRLAAGLWRFQGSPREARKTDAPASLPPRRPFCLASILRVVAPSSSDPRRTRPLRRSPGREDTRRSCGRVLRIPGFPPRRGGGDTAAVSAAARAAAAHFFIMENSFLESAHPRPSAATACAVRLADKPGRPPLRGRRLHSVHTEHGEECRREPAPRFRACAGGAGRDRAASLCCGAGCMKAGLLSWRPGPSCC